MLQYIVCIATDIKNIDIPVHKLHMKNRVDKPSLWTHECRYPRRVDNTHIVRFQTQR